MNQRKYNNIFTDLIFFFKLLNFRFWQVSQSFDYTCYPRYCMETELHNQKIEIKIYKIKSYFLGQTHLMLTLQKNVINKEGLLAPGRPP